MLEDQQGFVVHSFSLKRSHLSMRKPFIALVISSLLVSPILAASEKAVKTAPYTSTKETLQNITPEGELKRLMAGNARFANNGAIQRNLLQQAKATNVKGQFPAAVILSCMDSRGSPELIFDQGLGDVFSVRVAGNVVDVDQLGGMEYATKAIGTKLIVVMGHTSCGAVKGACQNVQLGNLTDLLNKIQPAVSKVKDAAKGDIDCDNAKTVDDVAKQNVLDMMQEVTDKSPIIKDLISNKKVLIVGAMHDLHTGKVTFFDDTGTTLK
jgi:carbonic anhydrase